MDGPAGRFIAQIRALSIPARVLVLLAITGAAGLIGVLSVWNSDDTARFWAAATAWMVCSGSATVALVLSLAWHGTPSGVGGALGGMLVGLGVPLGLAMAVQRGVPSLAEAGFYGWVVVFYLVALTVKTVLVAPGFAPAGTDEASSAGEPNTSLKKPGA